MENGNEDSRTALKRFSGIAAASEGGAEKTLEALMAAYREMYTPDGVSASNQQDVMEDDDLTVMMLRWSGPPV